MGSQLSPLQYATESIVKPRQFPKLVSVSHQWRHPILDAFELAEYGQLSLSTPDGHLFTFGGYNPGPDAYMQLHDPQALDVLLASGEMGFVESYINGLWDSNDLPSLMAFGLANAKTLENYFYSKPLYNLWVRLKNLMQFNSLSGSQRNTMAHHDLCNEFYELWLDQGMTYSGAIFGGNHNISLETAQQAKYQRIIDKIGAKPGDNILDMGCGWGGFMEYAASKGIRVTGITISQVQKAYGDKRLFNAGLNNLADIKLVDYREVEGRFDHIVSIDMFEHIGEQYWPTYFHTIKSCLKAHGKALVQTITIDDDIFERTGDKRGFIETYIFPEGRLPSKKLFNEAIESTGLKCEEMFAFGEDYALTIRHWLKRFDAHEVDLRNMGYSNAFIRMWRMHLASCIAAFTVGRTDAMQVELVHAYPN